MSSEGRTCIVTGAARGIGLATAQRMAALDYAVVGFDAVSPDEAVPPGVEMISVDLSEPDAVGAAVADALGNRPPLRALCSVAGIRRGIPVADYTAESWDQVFAVNVRASFLLLQACLPALLAQPGASVVFVGSPAAVADPEDLAYSSSKAALVAMARSAALAYLSDGLRVNVVTPGFTASAMTSGADAARRSNAAARNVSGEINAPDDVASAIAWLCSPQAHTISGAVLDVGSVWGLPARAVVPGHNQEVPAR